MNVYHQQRVRRIDGITRTDYSQKDRRKKTVVVNNKK